MDRVRARAGWGRPSASIVRSDHFIDPGKAVLLRRLHDARCVRNGGAYPVAVAEDPRQAARELLEQLGIHYLPVEPLLVTSLLRLSVRLAPLLDLDCEAIMDRRIDPPVCLAARPDIEPGRPLNENRLRFTIGHLLANYVLPHHRAQIYRCRQLWAGADQDPAEKDAKILCYRAAHLRPHAVTGARHRPSGGGFRHFSEERPGHGRPVQDIRSGGSATTREV